MTGVLIRGEDTERYTERRLSDFGTKIRAMGLQAKDVGSYWKLEEARKSL